MDLFDYVLQTKDNVGALNPFSQLRLDGMIEFAVSHKYKSKIKLTRNNNLGVGLVGNTVFLKFQYTIIMTRFTILMTTSSSEGFCTTFCS